MLAFFGLWAHRDCRSQLLSGMGSVLPSLHSSWLQALPPVSLVFRGVGVMREKQMVLCPPRGLDGESMIWLSGPPARTTGLWVWLLGVPWVKGLFGGCDLKPLPVPAQLAEPGETSSASP